MNLILYEIFGEGRDLYVHQMCARAVVIFFISWGLLRISGRRSFGLRTPLDNIITISLGAILSRAVVGVSPFVPVVAACLVIVLMHRFVSWLKVRSRKMEFIMEGDKIVLFENGRFLKKNLDKALVCEEDLMQGIRKSASTEDLSKIEKVYMERNGEISVLKAE